MPTIQRDTELILSRPDGVTTVVALPLYRGNKDLPEGYEEGLVSPTPEPVAGEGPSYEAQSPEIGRVFSQHSWAEGFGESLCDEPARCKAYGYSDGVLAMFGAQLSLGYQQDQVDIIVRGGRFDDLSSLPWTASNCTLTLGTDPNTGRHQMRITGTGASPTATQAYPGTLSVLAGRQITIVVYAKRVSGTGTLTLQILDDGGTWSSAASSSASYEKLEVTRTLSSPLTTLSFRFALSVATDVWDVDDLGCVATGGSEWHSGVVEFGGSAYAACGRMILKWSESNDAWLPVYCDANYEIACLESFGGALYAGRGSNANYLRSTDGATWANPATNTGNARFADFFARCLNAAGDWALLKMRNNQAALAIDPSDTNFWSTEYQVGDPDRAVTSATALNGTVYIGREDGLFVYDRDIYKFMDIEPGGADAPHPKNYKAALGRAGSLYVSGGAQTLWQVSPIDSGYRHVWKSFGAMLRAEGYQGFAGGISALAQDRSLLFAAQADSASSAQTGFPYGFPFAFSSTTYSSRFWLMAMRFQRDDKHPDDQHSDIPVPHTVTHITATQIDRLGVFHDLANSMSSLFVMGSYTDASVSAADKDMPRCLRIRLPQDSENPVNAASPQLRQTGSLFTPTFDFGFPDVEKALVKLSLESKNLNASKTVTVSYKIDDATDNDEAGWAPWGGSGVFDTSPSESQAAATSTPVTFRRIRLKLDFLSDSYTDPPPIVTGIVMSVAWNPSDFRRFRAIVRLTDQKAMQLRRVRRTTLRPDDVASLQVLAGLPFVQVTTPLGETFLAHIQLARRPMSSRSNASRDHAPARTELIEITGTEVKVS